MAASTSTTLDDLFANIIAQARFTAEEESLMMGLVTLQHRRRSWQDDSGA